MNNSENDLKITGERLMVEYKNKTAVEHLHRYSIAKDYVNQKIVLDIASGEGYGSNLLAQTAKFVYGVDISKEAVLHAAKKYKKSNLNFLEGSASKIPLDTASVDVLVSFETIEHHDQHEQMMRECKRVLKEDGILIISSPDKKYFSDIPQYRNEFHVKELYKEQFYKLVKSYFSTVHLYKQGVAKGSIIYNEENLRETNLLLYTGDFNSLQSIPDINAPVYNLIIACNMALPAHPNSYFESDYIDADLIEKIESYQFRYEDLLKSKSYQLGRLITLPGRVLKKLVSRKKI